MYYALAVRVGESVGDIPGNATRGRNIQLTLAVDPIT
jgi:hypothetical protein